MSFDELVLSNVLDLPILSSNKGFKHCITKKLILFLKAIESLDNLDIPNISVDCNYVKRVQKSFIEGLLKVIEDYYNGYPEKAYNSLNNTLIGNEKDFQEILKTGQYNIGEDFYRLRGKKENFPLTQIDMFHIPFENRGIVNTQRYSIPGFPSLYLGKSIYVCWEELNRPNINEFQVVRLESRRPIKYIDLIRPELSGNLSTPEIYRYVMTWPLIACCSVKVQTNTDTFKPEYIIPQLLLQWIRCNGEYDAIRYNSTHIVTNNQSTEFNSNLVLPVKESKDKGHCIKLKSIFKTTVPISNQLKEFALGGQIFVYGGSEESNENKIELINGRQYPYGYSIFGDLERYLKSMPTNKI